MKFNSIPGLFIVALLLHSCKKENKEDPTPFIGITIENTFKSQPDTIKFTATSTIPCSYTWDFGDSSAGTTGETVTHIFDIGYYYVTLQAVTDANKTATIFKGVNTSRFRRAVINNIRLTQIPATRTDGSSWDSDGSPPDVFCEISTGTRYATTPVLNNTAGGSGVNINLNFFPSFSDSLFEQPLVIKIFNSNEPPQEDDLMETITIDKNLIDLITNQEPYLTTKSFQNGLVSGQLTFFWAL